MVSQVKHDVRACVFGASGGLGRALTGRLQARNVISDSYSHNAESRSSFDIREIYPLFDPAIEYDLYFFCAGQFEYGPLHEQDAEVILSQVRTNLILPILIIAEVLRVHGSNVLSRRIDFVLIGSSSAYFPAAKTGPYSAAKFGLRGLVGALNAEYRESQIRFWLASMGTMASEMGSKVPGQDSETLLRCESVADRILDSVLTDDNVFEPEILIMRRVT